MINPWLNATKFSKRMKTKKRILVWVMGVARRVRKRRRKERRKREERERGRRKEPA